jgi:hypothetical protein
MPIFLNCKEYLNSIIPGDILYWKYLRVTQFKEEDAGLFVKYIRFLIKDYLFTVFSIIFVIAYWVSAHKLRFASIQYPLVISIFTVIFIIWNLVMSVQEFLKLYKAEGNEKEKWDCTLGLTKKRLIVIGVTILYAGLIPVLGFCVSTFLYIAGLVVYLGERKPVPIVIYSAVMTGLMYLIFKAWLMVRIPEGIFF